MRLYIRALLTGLTYLPLLSGCLTSTDSGGDPGSAESISAAAAGSGGGGPTHVGFNASAPGVVVHDGVVATSSVAGPVSVVVGSSQTVSITFNSTDGRTIGGLAINDSL